MAPEIWVSTGSGNGLYNLQWHLSKVNFTIDTSVMNHLNQPETYLSKISLESSRGQHGEYMFPGKSSSTFQGLFQGHFSSFQGHFQGRSTCVAVKKHRKLNKILNFYVLYHQVTNHSELVHGNRFFSYIFWVFFPIEMRSIYDNSR